MLDPADVGRCSYCLLAGCAAIADQLWCNRTTGTVLVELQTDPAYAGCEFITLDERATAGILPSGALYEEINV